MENMPYRKLVGGTIMSSKNIGNFRRNSHDFAGLRHLSRAKFLSFSQILENRIENDLVPSLQDWVKIEDIVVGWNDKKMIPGMVTIFIGVEGDDNVMYSVSQTNGGEETFLTDLIANVKAFFAEDEIPF